jgi:hypothetical protein
VACCSSFAIGARLAPGSLSGSWSAPPGRTAIRLLLRLAPKKVSRATFRSLGLAKFLEWGSMGTHLMGHHHRHPDGFRNLHESILASRLVSPKLGEDRLPLPKSPVNGRPDSSNLVSKFLWRARHISGKLRLLSSWTNISSR